MSLNTNDKMTTNEALLWADTRQQRGDYGESLAPVVLAAEVRRLRDALRFIAENGGGAMAADDGTDEGTVISCNGGWCAEQARRSLDHAL